jgi:hypothetical protein
MYMKCQNEIRGLEKDMEVLRSEKQGLKDELEQRVDDFA